MFTKRQREIVEHAYKTTKFYKKLENKLEWDNIKGMEDFPFTCKDNLVLQNEEFISDCYVAHYIQQKLINSHTSGSTGKCANVIWSVQDCRKSLLPLWLKRKKYYNVNPHDKYCYFFTTRNSGKKDIEEEKFEYALGFCKSNLNENKLVEIWNKMRTFEPIWMNLQPSMAILLCNVIKKYNLKNISTLKYIELTGEMLFPETKYFIQSTMNVRVANQYGCMEMNSIAYECPKGSLHCMEQNVIVEVVDKHGQLVPDGKEGEIVVSTLNNFAMPLIRYKLGDVGRIINKKCACGNRARILELTSGRNNDWIKDMNGNLINPYIFVRCVENVNKMHEHAILQFQIIQFSYSDFLVKLVISHDLDENVICNCFIDNLWQDSLFYLNVQFDICSKLIPDKGTGKLQWFISKI